MIKLNLSGHANAALGDLGFVFPGTLQVDLTQQDLPAKVVSFLSPLMGSGDVVQVVLPGLSPLAGIVLAVIHGLTGQFPTVIALVRQQDGSFLPTASFDLQLVRNDIARTQRADVIAL